MTDSGRLFPDLLLRFAGVGAFSTLAYMLVTDVSVQWLALAPVLASLAGYCLCIPVSYLGQKYLTFRSAGAHRIEFPRFIAMSLIAFGGTVGSMSAVTALGWNYLVGILAGAILVPLGSFIAMQVWVFRARGEHSSRLRRADKQ